MTLLVGCLGAVGGVEDGTRGCPCSRRRVRCRCLARTAVGRRSWVVEQDQQVGVGQESEEVVEGSVDVVVVDPDAVEEGLVEDLAVGVAGLFVELVAVFEKVERTREGALLHVDGSGGVCQALLDAFERRSTAPAGLTVLPPGAPNRSA